MPPKNFMHCISLTVNFCVSVQTEQWLQYSMYTNLDETKIRGLTDRGHSKTETRHAAHRIVLVKVKEAPLTPVTFDALNILLKNQV